jgi:hypothetical protein
MEKILLKALEKNSSDRFASMAEFMAALESPTQARMLMPAMRPLDRTPPPVRVPTITGGPPSSWPPGLDAASNMRATGMPQGTLSPFASKATPVTYVPIPRRSLVVGGAVAAAAIVLLVGYLLFGRGRGNETVAGQKSQITTMAPTPVPAVQPVAIPSPPTPPVEPKPAPVATTAPTPEKPGAETKPAAAAEKSAPSSGSGRPRASGRRSKSAPSAASSEAPSETAEKW